jgi:Ser/Thr protein kinase RdoA (MazF antagonist)
MILKLEILKSIIVDQVLDFATLYKGENDTYIIKTVRGWDLILKLYRLSRLKHIDVKTEIELTQVLLRKGIHSSEYLPFSSGKYIEFIGPQMISLQKLIGGYMLFAPAEEDYRKLGTNLRELHQKTADINNFVKVPVLNFETVVQDNWINVLGVNFLNKEIFSKINYYKDLVKDRFDFSLKNLVHFDAHFGNFIFHNEKIYFIDWEESGLGNPILDIAVCNCHLQRMENGKKFLYSLLDGYEYDIDIQQVYIGTIAKFLGFMGNIPVRQDISVLKEPLKIFERYVSYFERFEKEGNL